MDLYISSYCRLTNQKVLLNGVPIPIQRSESNSSSWLHDIYHTLKPDYAKFFKMDRLSKAGFLAAELVLKEHLTDRETLKTDFSIVFANRSASLDDDKLYQTTIQQTDNYFPSPSVFVFTLANIVTGEIAIRHKIMGETSFFIMENFDASSIISMTENTFS
ncbi:MAG: 3-oxoacyl-ACP synthase, partial [Bacteroidales bacterium]|nr:3-oxoacyl-ACP synthase [Bacteroidales bacterium]